MIRIRVVIALVVVSVLFLSIVYNKFEQSLFSDKVENVELQMKNQISTMVSAFEADSKFLLKWAHSLNNEGTRRINWNAMAPFFAVAQLNAKYQVVEWSFRENSPVSSLTKESLAALVYSFHVNPENTQISFQFYQDQDKKKVLLTLVPVKEKLWVFASLGENLQNLMDGQKTLSSSLALVNKDLISLAHVKPEYVGQKIFENAVIKDLKENNKTSSSGSFSITSGEEFFAVMEKVPNMEMYLYSQSSLSDIIRSKEEFRRQFAFFSFGFIFILAGLSFLLVPETKKVLPTPAVVAPPAPVPAPKLDLPKTAGAIASEEAKNAGDFAKERLQNNMKVASALGHEMKAPLVKILSLVQMGNFAASKEEVAKVLNKVQWEARSANEIIDKLLLFAGEKDQNKINTKIDTPLLRAIKNMEALCYQKVVKITKEIGLTDAFDMDVNQLITVFENLIKNSVQAMDRKSNKEIRIKTSMKNSKVVVLIEDNGEGVPKEIGEKIFDPFFTSMNIGQHMGLGLTVALGIAKQHNGNVLVDSERGQGARVSVEFEINHAGTEETATTSEKIPSVVAAPKSPTLPNIIAAPISNEPDVFIIDESPDIQAPVSLAPPIAKDRGKLNIPVVSEEVVLSIDEDKLPAFGMPQDHRDHSTKPVEADSGNELFDELNVSTKPISMKPVDLNVDVDKLFEIPNETPVKPTATVAEKVATTVAAAPIVSQAPKVSFISGPKESAPHVTRTRASDEFKVTIRKPGRPV